MRYLAFYALILAAVLGLSSALPRLYFLLWAKRPLGAQIYYSAVIDDIVYWTEDKNLTKTYRDASGKSYNRREFESLLPFFFYKDLEKWGIAPKEVKGIPILTEIIERERDFITLRGYAIEAELLRTPLNPLFDTEGTSTLEMPAELFRITNRLEFINAASNSVNAYDSERYTKALLEAGFTFPAKLIAGNPDPRKPYDFGYFLVDSKNELFHLYNSDGEPIVVYTRAKIEEEILYINVDEDKMNYYGVVVTKGGAVYILEKEGYRLARLDIGTYEPLKDTFRYYLDPLNVTVKITSLGQRASTESVYVLNREYGLEKTFSFTHPDRLEVPQREVYSALFPFVLSRAQIGYPVIKLSDSKAAPLLSALLAVAFIFYRIKRGEASRKRLAFDTALILVGGVYSLLSLALIYDL